MEKEKNAQIQNKNKMVVWIVIGAVFLFLVFIAAIIPNSSDRASFRQDRVYSCSETAKNSDGVSFKILNVENTNQVGTDLLGEKTDNNFIIITIKISNYSNKEISVYSGNVDLYLSNVKYSSKHELYIDSLISEDIGVGVSKTFQVLFETPTKSSQQQYVAKIGYSIYTPTSKRVCFDISTFTNRIEESVKYTDCELNETISFDSLNIKAVSFDYRDYFNTEVAGTGYKFLYINMNIENASNSIKYVHDYYMYINYNETAKYTTSSYLNDPSNYIYANYDIIPYGEISGRVVFKVPEKVRNSGTISLNFTFNKTAKQTIIAKIWIKK